MTLHIMQQLFHLFLFGLNSNLVNKFGSRLLSDCTKLFEHEKIINE